MWTVKVVIRSWTRGVRCRSIVVDLRIDHIAGVCPVQADGTVNGRPFYFRARHGSWSFVGALHGDPVEVYSGSHGFLQEATWGAHAQAADHMPEGEARQIIARCAVPFAEWSLAAETSARLPVGGTDVST